VITLPWQSNAGDIRVTTAIHYYKKAWFYNPLYMKHYIVWLVPIITKVSILP